MSYKTLEKHTSPDGLLTFSVLQYPDEDNDISLGFENFDWHTHADILAATSDLAEEKAIRQFVNDLLNNRQIIAVVKKGNKIAQVRITEDPIAELKYRQDDEVLEFRYWNGQKLKFEKCRRRQANNNPNIKRCLFRLRKNNGAKEIYKYGKAD